MNLCSYTRPMAGAFLALSLACSDPSRERAKELDPAKVSSTEELKYPPGRWRLSSLGVLQHSIVWASHILIRHRGSSLQAPGTFIPWYPAAPAPTRSRDEGLALAQRIAKEAGAAPDRFAQLASQYSEDVSTAPQGGALGGLRAGDLYLSEPLLDALAQLEVGAVSHPVETDAGFHVIHREAQPSLTTVSGVRIVINYSEARALPATLLPSVPRRTRAEALALATEVYRQAVERPDIFDALVQRYSEHRDREDGGYFGTWSRWEPSHLPREVHVLASLSVGDVAPPLDSPYGFEIVRRTPIRASEQPIAVEVARMRFDSASSESEQAAEKQMAELLRTSRAEPGRFDEFRAAHCCIAPERWYRGRQPGFTRSMEALPVGALSTELLREHGSFAIAKRVELERLPPEPPVRFGLPAPTAPDPDELASFFSWTAVAFELAAAAEWARGSLGLTPGEEQALLAFASESEDVSGALKAFLAQSEATLRHDVYARYREQVDGRLGTLLLRRGNSVLLQ